MKKLIYALPINEAFDKNCACPLCEIENGLDTEAVEYTVGAAMMEPEFRIVTNKKGFCKHHASQLLKQGNSLSLALIMQSQIDEQNKNISGLMSAKKALRKKTKKQTAAECADYINGFVSSCAVCDKVGHTMDKFISNIVYLFKTEAEFRDKFARQQFCLPHLAKLLQYGTDGLSDAAFETFFDILCENESKLFSDTLSDVTEYTQMFDHRTGGTPPQKVKTALRRGIHIYTGFMKND